MTTSTDISRRFWNLPQKADEETAREQTYIDDIIQKAHIERLLLESLNSIKTAFDGGAGYGALLPASCSTGYSCHAFRYIHADDRKG